MKIPNFYSSLFDDFIEEKKQNDDRLVEYTEAIEDFAQSFYEMVMNPPEDLLSDSTCMNVEFATMSKQPLIDLSDVELSSKERILMIVKFTGILDCTNMYSNCPFYHKFQKSIREIREKFGEKGGLDITIDMLRKFIDKLSRSKWEIKGQTLILEIPIDNPKYISNNK